MAKSRGTVIGCGFFASNHLNGWKELADRCEIVAVCDIDRAKAEAAAKAFGIPRAYSDAAEMLRTERPDFADIVTTAPSHRPLVELCAAQRVAAIVQKPIALDWNDAVALVSAMAKAGTPLMVHENFRFQRPMLRALDILRSGEIGAPIWGRFSWRTNFNVYAGQPYLAEIERFILMDIGVHVLDLARAFLGEANSVFCRTNRIKPGIAGEDMATALLSHTSGVTSVCDFTYESRRSPDPFPLPLIEIEGRQGSLVLDSHCQLAVRTAQGVRQEDVGPRPLAWSKEPWLLIQDSVVSIQAHWLDCLAAGRESATSGRDNLNTFALVEACYESAARNAAVTPKSWG